MASKHSKSFFDFRKNPIVTPSGDSGKKSFSLPFKIIISVLVVSLVVSTFFLGRFFIEGSSHKKMQANARETFNSAGYVEAIKTLAQQNGDIKGWIKIEGTEINDAICQKDDDFYKNHNQLGKKSRYGALYLSSNDNFGSGDLNVTIYGNNMKDDTMFGSLQEFCNLHYFKEHPYIDLFYGNTHQRYVVVAAMLLPATNNEYDITTDKFIDQADFENWYNEALSRSFLHTNTAVQYGDEFLTLITDANDFEGARFAVLTKKISDNDTTAVDLTKAAANTNIKQPKAWYTKRGLKYPY